MRKPRSRSRSAAAERPALALAVALTLGGAAGARAQSVGEHLSDPKKCVVVVEDMGNVGLRISDAQVIAEAVVSALRKRVGYDGVTYAGIAKSAETMKRLLATPEGAGPQEAQLKWFQACEQAAPWRVKARFGRHKGKNWVTVACRKRDDKDDVEEKRFEAKTFLESRDQLAAAMSAFCPALAPAAAPAPAESADGGILGLRPKEAPKPWTPPPRRD